MNPAILGQFWFLPFRRSMKYKRLAALCGIFLVMAGLNVSCNDTAQAIALEIKAAPKVALGDNAAVRISIKNMPEDITEVEMTWHGFGPEDLPRPMTIGLPRIGPSPSVTKALQLTWESSNAGILGTDATMPSFFSDNDDNSPSGTKDFSIEHYLQTLLPGSTEITFTLKDGNDILATQKVDITITK
jgi:hypothetical protein